MKLYCATTSAGKLREFRLAGLDVEVLPGLADIPAVEETGATFEENAILKARYYAEFAEGPLFTDDSGLEVDALNGAPGVYSARFAGPSVTDDENNAHLLKALEGATQRTARYVCVLALVDAGRVLGTYRGEVAGEILTVPRGTGGFGYDPLFWYQPLARSFGELSNEEKFAVSHRGCALRLLRSFVETSRPRADTGHARR